MSLLSPQLEAFISVVTYKTVHGAAQAIHLTQTAVTQRIRALETKLRTTLFIRTRRGMRLTQEGEALIRYCHAAKELEGLTLATIQKAAIETEIHFSITGPTSLMMSRVIPACLPINKKFPQLYFEFDIEDAENRQHKLKTGNVDLAIISPENSTKEMIVKTLKPEQYILVGPANWKNRKLHDILHTEHIIDFNNDDQMTFNYLKAYNLFTSAQHQRHFANRTDALALMVSAGLGYTALAKEFAKPYINNGSLITLNKGQIYDHYYLLAWYPRPEPPLYFTTLVHAIH